MTVTRLYLVRHGATQLTAEDRFAGSGVGPTLSDEGRRQVERLAARISDDGIKALYCSPLSRTVETAEILARPHGLTLVHRDGLREIGHGRWEGLTRGEVEERYAEEYAAWEEDPFIFAPQDGESGLAVLARAMPVVREIVVAHPGECVLVVSHKATLRLILSSLRRHRRAGLPRPARPVAGLPQRGGLQGPGARAPHAVQRHLALRRRAAHRGAQPVEVVGRGS